MKKFAQSFLLLPNSAVCILINCIYLRKLSAGFNKMKINSDATIIRPAYRAQLKQLERHRLHESYQILAGCRIPNA